MLLTLAIVLGLMSACGDTSTVEPSDETMQTASDPVSQPPQGTVSSVTDSAQEEPAPVASPEEWTLPLSDGSDTLTLMACFPDPLFAEYPNGCKDLSIYKAAEELTGVNIDWTCLSNSQASETFLLTIASQTYSDMFGWGLNYAGGNELAIEEDVYMDLTETISQYAPNYYGLIYSDPELLSAIQTDSGYLDTFYSLTLEEAAYCDAGPQIRADILDELDMEKPYTYDELHEYLLACRDKYNMSEPLILPASFAYNYNYLASGFGVAGRLATVPEYELPFHQVDGQIHFGIVEPGYLDYITMLHTYMEEGLISDAFVQENIRMLDTDEVTNKILTGQSGFWANDLLNIDGYNNASEIEGFRVEATYDIHQDKDSVNHFAEMLYKGGNGGIHFSTQCSNVELATQWCDFWYTDEGSMLANYGVEGEGYTMENGVPTYTDLIADNPNYNLANALLIYASNGTICGVADNERQYPIYSDIMLQANELWHTGSDDEYLLPANFSLTAEENEEYSGIASDLATLCEEKLSMFITGDASLDDWDGFVDSLYTTGLQDAIDIYQGALARYLP